LDSVVLLPGLEQVLDCVIDDNLCGKHVNIQDTLGCLQDCEDADFSCVVVCLLDVSHVTDLKYIDLECCDTNQQFILLEVEGTTDILSSALGTCMAVVTHEIETGAVVTTHTSRRKNLLEVKTRASETPPDDDQSPPYEDDDQSLPGDDDDQSPPDEESPSGNSGTPTAAVAGGVVGGVVGAAFLAGAVVFFRRSKAQQDPAVFDKAGIGTGPSMAASLLETENAETEHPRF
jgi:hypothetical protein